MKVALLLIVAILLFPTAMGKINVVVSMPDFECIVEEIGGINASVILPAGADPHSFSITKDVIDEIKKADLIILANSALLSYEKDIKENYNKDYLDFEDYEKIELFDFDGFKQNPHGYWLYANNSVAIAKAIAYKLAEVEPDKADYYITSFNNFEKRVLEAKKNAIEIAKENGIYGKKVVAAVPGVCYIAKNVGMDADKILFAESVALLNAKEIEEIKEKLEKGEYVGIIVPEFLKEAKVGEIARQIAYDSNSSVIYVKFATGGDSYINLFYYNVMQMISLGSKKAVKEENNLPLIYLSISLALLAAFEGFLLYKCRRIK